jgi:hypothetical protein
VKSGNTELIKLLLSAAGCPEKTYLGPRHFLLQSSYLLGCLETVKFIVNSTTDDLLGWDGLRVDLFTLRHIPRTTVHQYCIKGKESAIQHFLSGDGC